MRGDFVVCAGVEASDSTDININQSAYIPNEVGTHELFTMAWGDKRAVVSITVEANP